MQKSLLYIAAFVVLVLLQLFLIDNIALSVYFHPLVYVAFVIMLPLDMKPVWVLLCSTLMGLTIDALTGMAGINVKDGLVKLLKMDSMTRGINVSINNNKLTLNFHVIIAYGVSILAVSDNLISNVKYKVEEFTGIEIEKINIFVEGVRVID